MKKLVKCLGSFFCLGYVPVIPGTIASGFGLLFYFLFSDNIFLYSLFLILVTAAGFLICGRAEQIFRQKDSPKIVIDEVAGVLLAFWGISATPLLLFVGFVIYRAFDIFKVPPAGRIEKIAGSTGVMGDDLLAGLYTNIILQIVMRLG